MKLYRNWIINEVARAGEHTNEHTYVLTYIRTGQTLYPLHNFVVRGDNNLNSLTTIDKIAEFANSVGLDEVAHNEPPHQDLPCLPSSL